MKKAHFKNLLQKYLQGKATEAEKQFLMSYYDLFDAEPGVEDFLNLEQKEELKNNIKNSVWESIDQKEQQVRNESWVIPVWIKIFPAAALILAICITGIFFIVTKSQKEKIIISQTIEGKGHQLIRLPDGSLVILERGSKLQYPLTFDDSDLREVFLTGQAYFDVKHNSSKPFIVHAGSIKTTVLGTSFNIKAWPAEKDVSITVTKGKVKVEDQHKIFGTVVKDQQLTLFKEKAEVIQSEVDAKASLEWREQDLFMDNVTLSEVAKLLEDRYEVNINCNPGALNSERFTLTILKGESLEHVLTSICEFNNIVYQFDEEIATVTISKKK